VSGLRTPLVPRLLDLGNRPGIHVLDYPGNGPPVVFVHGYASNAHIWDDAIPMLRAGRRALALDLRGHGLSKVSSARHYGMPHQVSDVLDLLEALDLRKAVLVGHSWGASIVAAAAAASSRVAGLVLVEGIPASISVVSEHMRTLLRALATRFRSLEEAVSLFRELHPAADVERVRRFAAASVRLEGDEWLLRIDRHLLHCPDSVLSEGDGLDGNGWETLRRIRCPTLIVAGAWSSILPRAEAQTIADEVLANGAWVVVPRAGHSVMLDNPEEFAANVWAFCAAC
jgi:pimeloyl-ACP methyl ester carboxylesterase